MATGMRVRTSTGAGEGTAPIRLWLSLVLAASALNLVTDALASRPPLFLLDLRQRFDDYFAFILSFAPHERLAPARWFADRIAASPAPGFPKFAGVEGLPHASLTNLHVTPLTASFCLLTVRLMRVLDPSLLFLGALALLGAYWFDLARRHAPAGHKATMSALGLVAYPTLMLITRGNVYAGAAALLAIHALLLALRGERPALSGALLAVAVNIRPNAAPLLLPLLALQPAWRPALAAFAAASAGVLVGSLALAHQLRPEYTLLTFLAGLENYHWFYVVQEGGVGYGSSLYGALAVLVGPRPWAEALGAVAALMTLAAGAALHHRRPLDAPVLLFLPLAAYTLGSSVIADYHLLVFVLPLLATGERTRAVVIAQVASALMLAPKNLAMAGDWSIQVVLNPAILLGATVAILAREWEARRASSIIAALA